MKLVDYLRQCAQRSEHGSKPALVVQGGGMRGIYSIGALAALADADLRDAFGAVVGSSAGAVNAAYFLAGQVEQGLRIYLDDLSTSRFINPRRLWRVVDVDHLIDDVLRRRHPLDRTALQAASADLRIVLTDAVTGAAHVVRADEAHDLYEVLRATCALPALYNKQIRIGGRRYIDGGVVAPVPVEQAFAAGAGQALVVMTRAFDFQQDDMSAPMRRLGVLLARGQQDFVKDNIARPNPHYAALLTRLRTEGARSPRTTWTVAPTEIILQRTTIDAQILQHTADLGRADMAALLEQEYLPDGPLAPDGSGRPNTSAL